MAVFAQAARELGLAPSAVTLAVQSLERELDVKLLVRSTRSLALTEAGRAFFDGCTRMVDAARDAFAGVELESGEVAGRLTVSAAISSAPTVAFALAQLAREHPRLVPELRIDEHVLDLVRDPVDLAIRSGWLEDASIVARKLCDLPERLVASPDYLQRFGTPARIEELHQHRLIQLSAFSRPGTLPLAAPDGTPTPVHVPAAAVTNNSAAVQALAVAGIGLARLPLANVRDDLHSGRLVHVLPAYQLAGAAVYAVTLQRSPLPRKVTVAIAAMKAAFARSSASP
ncbi:MAG: LysR family transcriptional regulator [Burkholderiales bacterium]